MAYKLLALDFDGTLLPYGAPDGVSERVLAALRAARDAGVTLCAATGRSLTEAAPAMLCMADLFAFGAMANGAQVYRFPDELMVSHAFMPEETRRILRVLRSYPGLFLQAFLGPEPYCEEGLWKDERLMQIAQRYADMTGQPLARASSFEQLFEEQGQPSKLFLIAGSTAQADEIARAVYALGIAEATGSAEDNVEILPLGVSKVSGIRTVCEALGIAREEVMAIGDSANDLDMLHFAGLGVAMGNAPDGVKSAANVVTESVEDDGAALAIERYILRGEEP